MNLQQIQELWSEDCKIDKSELDKESLRIPEIHNKYYKIFLGERIVYREMENEHNNLVKLKHQYYLGKFSDEDYKETGWSFQPKIISKLEIPMYLSSDKHMQDSLMKLSAQKEKIDYLDSIIRNLNNRNFIIKNAIDFLRWSHGTT